MKLAHKTSEQLQSQVANYARSKHGDTAEALFDALPPIKGGVELGDGGMAIFRGYVQHLKDTDSRNRSHESDVAQLLGAFSSFRDKVKDIADIAADDPYNPEIFIGEGQSSRVYKLAIGDQSYAMRAPKETKLVSTRHIVNNHLWAGAIGSMFPHLERVVAGSYSEGVIISEYIPALSVDQLSNHEVNSISQDHMDDLIETMLAASQAGVEFDAIPANLLHNHSGFYVIDYGYDEEHIDDYDPLDVVIKAMWQLNLTCLGDRQTLETTHQTSFRPDQCRKSIVLLEKLRASTAKLLKEEDKNIALEVIDKCITDNQAWLEKYAPSLIQ